MLDSIHQLIIKQCDDLTKDLHTIDDFPKTNIVLFSVFNEEKIQTKYYCIYDTINGCESIDQKKLVTEIIHCYPKNVLEKSILKVAEEVKENEEYNYLNTLVCFTDFLNVIRGKFYDDKQIKYIQKTLDVLIKLLQAINFKNSIVSENIMDETNTDPFRMLTPASLFSNLLLEGIKDNRTYHLDFVLGYLIEEIIFQGRIFYIYNIKYKDIPVGSFVFRSPRNCAREVFNRKYMFNKTKDLIITELENITGAPSEIRKLLWDNTSHINTEFITPYEERAVS